MWAVYIVEQNVKVSSSCVYHRLYFTHKLKNPIIKPHRKISKEPVANYSSGFWHHSSPTLFHDRFKWFFAVMTDTRGWNITTRTLLWKEMRLFQFWRPQSGCSRASVNPREHLCSLMSENLCLTFFLMWSHKTIGGILGETLATTSAQVNS